MKVIKVNVTRMALVAEERHERKGHDRRATRAGSCPGSDGFVPNLVQGSRVIQDDLLQEGHLNGVEGVDEPTKKQTKQDIARVRHDLLS